MQHAPVTAEHIDKLEASRRGGGVAWHGVASGTPIRLWLLLLAGGMPSVRCGYAFADRTALLAARSAWCENTTAAAAVYGPIADWDVSIVTDLTGLFCTVDWMANSHGCDPACHSFNADISTWDTSRVTTMAVRAASAIAASLITMRLCNVAPRERRASTLTSIPCR